MKKANYKLLINPFERIAGWEALAWGIGGLFIYSLLSYFSGTHHNGLLQFGMPHSDVFLRFAAERLVIWLIPTIIFCVGGLILSKSKVRMVDIFGTMAFSLLPFIPVALLDFLPWVRKMEAAILQIDMTASPAQMNEQVLQLLKSFDFIIGIIISIFILIFFVWVLIWMFKALKISCNLKGKSLWILYLIGIFGGDILTRIIISHINTFIIHNL
jgi:hypothetical protein